MKIMAVCGTGLGSSFILELNIEAVLKELGVEGVTVEHTDLGSVTPEMADVFIATLDLAEGMREVPELIVLNSIIDKAELLEKLTATLRRHGKYE
ncbi:MAG: PTS sugar transporter subunit IIB [Culicoidibacterales bacterium]